MSNKYVLVEHISDVNAIIKQPLQLTQRIKFTAFEVSQSYIVFGASSGGLYVFNRDPHQFLKLIPSKEGSIVQVSISPDEKHICLASSKGAVVIIPNCFHESYIEYQANYEHRGNLVTAMKWNGDELYCGDSSGKITVFLLPSLLTKAMFQPNCATLMQLDSKIVQIDVCSKFLLVSTLTRTYICDTDKEQFKQIGKKLRNGYFGACFLTKNIGGNGMPAETVNSSRGIFRKSRDDEQFFAQINDNVQIFCTRPGARMWEAKLSASVTHTHQFKNLLKNSIEVLSWNDHVNARLAVNRGQSTNELLMDELNFTKVLTLDNKFIVTFNQGIFYVFDPITKTIICWCDNFKNIKDFKVIGYFMYIWDNNLQVRIVALYMLEQIILKTLFRKQYYLSAELCIHYSADVMDLIEVANNIHLISILKEKITDEKLVQSLTPIFDSIKSYSDKTIVAQRLSTGIVAVNPFFNGEKIEKGPPIESVHILKDLSVNVTGKLTEGTKNLKEKFQILETTVKNLTLVDTANNKNISAPSSDHITKLNSTNLVKISAGLDPMKVFQQQYQMNKINNTLESPKFYQVLDNHNVNSVVALFRSFFNSSKDLADEKNVSLWCFARYLKYLFQNRADEIEKLSGDDPAIEYAFEAFTELNQSDCSCTCSYPTPSAKECTPKYYEFGCLLAKKIWSLNSPLLDDMAKKVPYMWKYILKDLRNNDAINITLPLLMQFGDEDLIENFSTKFKYDEWDRAIQLLIKLRNFKCVNCDQDITKTSDILTWTSFATILLKTVGAQITLNLLMRYSDLIPSDDLDTHFYQMCIFTTVAGGASDKIVNFTKLMHSNAITALEFDNTIKKFLRNNYLKRPSNSGKKSSPVRNKTDLKCSFCDLPIETVLLTDYVKLSCKHLYHAICYKYNENVCEQCQISS